MRRYHTVILIVPRRAGKTILVLAMLLQRLLEPGTRAWYTAQKREVGAASWRDDWFPLIEASAFRPLTTIRRANGSEQIAVPRLGSHVRLFAPPGEALRSKDGHVIVVDEARAFTLETGRALEGAYRPTQVRWPDRQAWIVSSAGNRESSWLAHLRTLAMSGLDPGIALFEWAAPAGLDPFDPATIRLAHPAVDQGVTVEAILADATAMDLDVFCAEYLGWWPDQLDDPHGSPIDPDAWAAAGNRQTLMAGVSHLALDVALDRSGAAIAHAVRRPDRTVAVELLAAGPGVDWLEATLSAASARLRPATVSVDTYGPGGNLNLEQRYGDRARLAATADVARSCATFADLVAGGRLTHRAQPELDPCNPGLRTRDWSDGGWLWSRRRSTVPTAAVIAGTLAAGAAAGYIAPKPIIATSA